MTILFPVQRRHSARDWLTDRPEARLLHDVRQSVAAMTVLVSVIQRDPLSEGTAGRLRQIRGEAEWMAAMLVRGDGEMVRLDVGEAVAEVWEHSAACAPCRVRLVRDPDLPAEVDAVALHRSVRNLIDNAVRAAGREGEVEVRVLAEGSDILVEVADSGPGFGAIPAGQGLGLETVLRFAFRHDGTLDHGTSHLGGTVVRLRLPRYDDSRQA